MTTITMINVNNYIGNSGQLNGIGLTNTTGTIDFFSRLFNNSYQ